jgi:ribonuclease HI
LLTHVEIHTDGACKGNPGPGGWGVRLQSGQHVQELFGGELNTTNNRMEMTAVIEGLLALKRPCQVTLYLDSEYVRKGITEWIHGWKARGWRTAAKQPVKTPICGKNWTRWCPLRDTRSTGAGSRATTATRATSVPMPLPTKAWRKLWAAENAVLAGSWPSLTCSDPRLPASQQLSSAHWVNGTTLLHSVSLGEFNLREI